MTGQVAERRQKDRWGVALFVLLLPLLLYEQIKEVNWERHRSSPTNTDCQLCVSVASLAVLCPRVIDAFFKYLSGHFYLSSSIVFSASKQSQDISVVSLNNNEEQPGQNKSTADGTIFLNF